MKRLFQLFFLNFICLATYSQNELSYKQNETKDCRALTVKSLNATIKKDCNAYVKENELHLDVSSQLKEPVDRIPEKQIALVKKAAREQALQTLINISGYIEDPQNICEFEFYIFHITVMTKDANPVKNDYRISRRAFNNLSGNFDKANVNPVLTLISK